MRIIPNLLIFLVLQGCETDSHRDQSFLVNLMQRQPEKFASLLENVNEYEIQIIYTQIDRDSANKPTFKTFYYNTDSTRYFYPASTVKFPLVLLSLEKLHELQIEGLNKFTPMFHDSVYSGQLSVRYDSSSDNKLPSVANYIRKILVISDNDAYNRLYEFMGQEAINNILYRKGFTSTRIIHRLERPLSLDENRHTEAVRFLAGDTIIYQQPALVNEQPVDIQRTVFKGKGYIDREGKLIHEPFEFTYKNFFPLSEQHVMLKDFLFPESAPESSRFELNPDDRQFVLKYMSQLPTETTHPPYYEDSTYYDAFCKFLMFGSGKTTIPKSIRIFNKIGDAYGFLIDNAYVVDFDNKIEFLLSAVIHVNADGIYNDGKYDYEAIGFPFMKNLGEVIYKYELGRERQYKPDLTEFQITYDR